jgi:tRNA pseudouridine32 synthase/23S rRNA pseudouridine746 synthase
MLIDADAHVLVVDKPTGLLAVPGRGEAGQDCLATRVQASFPGALVVHRLDMATSGLMLFAREASSQRALSMAFARRAVAKRYVATVAGRMADSEGEVALPLICDWPQRPRQKVDSVHGKPSLTRWKVLGEDEDATRVSLEPVTGRTHQLRVHMLAIGHPILGDMLYAPPQVQRRSPRLLLHASELTLAHPADGTLRHWLSPPPF